jgi:histidine ammonia-lyase
VRAAAPGPGPDRWLAPELTGAAALVESGAVVQAVEAAVGSLE